MNRNYGFKWGLDQIGSDDNPCSEAYRGKGPFSEPETQAMRDFIKKHVYDKAKVNEGKLKFKLQWAATAESSAQ